MFFFFWFQRASSHTFITQKDIRFQTGSELCKREKKQHSRFLEIIKEVRQKSKKRKITTKL